MKRRELLKLSILAPALGFPLTASAKTNKTDGTPAQFTPKTSADKNPLEQELKKHPKCPYCGMSRRKHHKTRMLVKYSDDIADGVCSIHCLAISLSINIDRDPKHIWGPNYATTKEVSELYDVDNLHYLIGAKLPHAMTARSKHSFISTDDMNKIKAEHGGESADFDAALTASYLDMNHDVSAIRKRRAEKKLRKMMKSKG